MTRIAPLCVALLSTTLPAWALEPGDVRLHLDIVEGDYDFSFGGSTNDEEFDHSYGLRVALVQPLNVLATGDLIAVLGLGFNDAQDEEQDNTGVELSYQTVTGRYGFGYRAELGSSFAIDAYPYVGFGWASFELGSGLGDDPSMLFEFGAEVDIAATFDQWQVGGTVGYGYRLSDHTVANIDFEMEHQALTFGGFVGYRF